jgi:hypothetical protein
MRGMIVYALILFALLYLFGLNLLLRGRLKPIIEGVLSLLCMAMLIAAFFLFGWKAGIGMIVFTFIAIPIAKALAVPVSRRLLGYRTGYGDYSAIETDSQRFMSGQLSIEDYMQNVGRREDRAKETLDRLARRADICAVLQENNISQEDYLELYWDLMKNALPDLVWDILGDAGRLRQLIALKKKGAPSNEISATFREYR